MVSVTCVLLLGIVAASSALPAKHNPVIAKYDEERYQYVANDAGEVFLADLWMTAEDLREVARYDADRMNVYHLFSRQNPSVSQPILMGNEGLLGLINYDRNRRTIFLLHGWQGSAVSDVNAVLVPAFLAAEDLNIIVVDWARGADTINYLAAVSNTVASGQAVARFINWLSSATETSPANYHVVGFTLGGHQAGVVGRNIEGNLAYITALDPAFAGWITHSQKLRRNDAAYTEVIHTNAGLLGYIGTLGHADFYPNGGISMPGCNSQTCDQSRSYFYFAESLITGGFTGRRCATYITAMSGACLLPGNLRMGGIVPKTGSSGIFHLLTNSRAPFSRG